MLDARPMYRVPWHPIAPLYNRDFAGRSKHYSRTERPPKYYYIDLGLSRKQNPNDGPPRELSILGGDKSVPEFQDDGYDDKPSDPFATDIYYLGNLIQKTFFDMYCSLDFITESVSDMVQAVRRNGRPSKRSKLDSTRYPISSRTGNPKEDWCTKARMGFPGRC
ncbi:hypothetical protein C8Q72DRAFT_837751 [Fomitopsis betulina]|nr:hypothetical protein C8Q72DRAFT_837751 [Fomitopsis betulina]